MPASGGTPRRPGAVGRGPKKLVIDSPRAAAVRAALAACASRKVDRSGCVGITTYIRDTCRAGVPFSASRASNARGKAGLSVGRVTDLMLQKWCNDEPVPTGFARRYFDNAVAALHREKLVPVATQVPCRLGHLKTELDLVCLRQGKTGNVGIVVVELKTSRQTIAQHTKTYQKRCLRKPYMNVGGYENTEAMAHRIQTDFGVRALLASHPSLKTFHVEGAVLYSTETGARMYPALPLPPDTYSRRHVGREQVSASGTVDFPLLPNAAQGGTLVREALKQAGHTKIFSGGRASCTTINKAGKKTTVGIVSKWNKLRPAQKREVVAEIKRRAEQEGGGPRPWLVVRDANGIWKAATAALNI